jgi:release factor glutamine methyltransferase
MHSPSKRVFFRDYAFDVCEEVYEPSEDSFLFAENLEVHTGDWVLDLGTGSGMLGVLAAKKAREVLSVDLNPYAVRCAKQNAVLNGVRDKMLFLQSDLFTAMAETAKFDLILFNAPYLPVENSEADSWLSRAWAGGTTGRQVIDRFISQAPQHLKQAGRILLMQSTLANVEETLHRFSESHMNAQVATELALPFFEKLILIKATYT